MFASLLFGLGGIISAKSKLVEPQSVYFANLAGLCGARFEGRMTFPHDEQHDFANKLLVANFVTCSESLIRVSFWVGEDRSRTWVFRKTSSGIELKHDHRHADGSPDEITNYGGGTLSQGTLSEQAFSADGFTQKLIPDAATNVWKITLSSDLSELIYHLERHGKPRFTAVFRRAIDRTNP